ncbi:MAG: TVP38/TMEM64 family protein [Tissierellia bacterium]|nr:TVP38/TMEM64 family protein [Tissierellia bacterium]
MEGIGKGNVWEGLLLKGKRVLDYVGWIFSLALLFALWRRGLLTDPEKLEVFLHSYGIWAPLIFMAIQAIQVVVPILPGAVGCLFGVLFFGPLMGFVYNYIGICLGSLWAFLLSRRYGAPFARQMTGRKFYDKYQKFLENEARFEKLLAFLIFIPFAPDDFLCYLAGVSRISFKKFTAIILLAKPFAIYTYTLAISYLYHHGGSLPVIGQLL